MILCSKTLQTLLATKVYFFLFFFKLKITLINYLLKVPNQSATTSTTPLTLSSNAVLFGGALHSKVINDVTNTFCSAQ